MKMQSTIVTTKGCSTTWTVLHRCLQCWSETGKDPPPDHMVKGIPTIAQSLAPDNEGPTCNWLGLRISRLSDSSMDAGATGGPSKSHTPRTAAPLAQICHKGDLEYAYSYVGRKELNLKVSNSTHSGDKIFCHWCKDKTILQFARYFCLVGLDFVWYSSGGSTSLNAMIQKTWLCIWLCGKKGIKSYSKQFNPQWRYNLLPLMQR